MANNRIEYLDLVKFFAICLVCIGHSYAKVPTLERARFVQLLVLSICHSLCWFVAISLFIV